MNDAFRRLAFLVASLAGNPVTFLLALVAVLAWAVTGPVFGFSDTWQLVINTATTIVTFLMVFLIQNTQNRDSQALHAKLDQLVIAMKGADNRLVEAETLSDEELGQLKDHLHDVAKDDADIAPAHTRVGKAEKALARRARSGNRTSGARRSGSRR